MLKRTTCYSILIALLSTLALASCVESSDQLDSPTEPEPKDSLTNHQYTGCSDDDVKLDGRCVKTDKFTKFAMASRVSEITFSNDKDTNPLFGLIGELGKKGVDVKDKVKEQVNAGKLNLIIEFLGWEKGADAPEDKLPIMFWPGTEPTDEGKKTTILKEKNEIKSTKGGDSAFSRSTFVNANYARKVDGEDGEYVVAATSIRPVLFPIHLVRVDTYLQLEEGASLKLTIKKKDDGIEIVDGYIKGNVTKQSLLDGIYKLQKNCFDNFGGDQCIKMDNSMRQCAPFTPPTQPACTNSDNTCTALANLCGREQGIIGHVFGSEFSISAKINVKGTPIEITGWQ